MPLVTLQTKEAVRRWLPLLPRAGEGARKERERARGSVEVRVVARVESQCYRHTSMHIITREPV